MKTPSEITHEEIAKRAHDIWEQSGRPEGQETEHWLRAERELQNERRHAEVVANKNGGQKRGHEMNHASGPRR